MSLVILPLWLREVIGRPAALAAATLFAVSTAFSYYSRYYIQEILLVYFTLAVIVSIVRYVKKPTLFWAISAGMNLGFLHATKETCILNLGVMVLSFIAVVLLFRQHRKAVGESLKKINIVHVGVSLFVAALMSFLLYSWFFTNPGGFLDAFAAYKTYFHRAVNNDIHNHPWYYYLKMLVYSKSNSGLLWTEGFVVIAAIVGIYFAVKSKNLFWRFAAIYAVLMTITYSAIPYKTPWTMLSFYSLFIILAGYAIGEQIQGTASKRCVLVILVFVPIFFGMGVLSFFANFKYSSDSFTIESRTSISLSINFLFRCNFMIKLIPVNVLNFCQLCLKAYKSEFFI
jgi:predicted membrane-bound mannosyltransferase